MTDGRARTDESCGDRPALGALCDNSPRRIGPYQVLARIGAGSTGEVYLGADPRLVAVGAEVLAGDRVRSAAPARAGAHARAGDQARTGTQEQPGGHVRPGARAQESAQARTDAPAEDAADAVPRLVAVRSLRTDLGHEPAFRERFGREVVAALPVRGRFVARLLAADPVAVHPWLATEYVPGPTLERAVCLGGPLPRDAVLRLALELAQALGDIHRAGIAHGDLRPANVLLGADGPKIVDFGIAREAAGSDDATATAAGSGSPAFLSPEHLLGPGQVVAASDVFALAAVLCHAATGTTPFGEGLPEAEVLHRVARAEAELAALPPQLRPLIEDCLVKDASARPDAAELEARFRAALAEGPHGAEPGAVAPARWPAAIDAEIRRYETELARTLAAAEPLPAPARPGAAPPPGAEPPGTATAPRPRPRRRTVTAVLAAAVSVGVLGSLGALGLGGDGTDARAGDAKPARTSPADARRTGVTTAGYLGSRAFPVAPAARPQGWKPWRTRLAGRPWACALNSDVLVCRTFLGGLEAVGAADGAPRWKEPAATRDRPRPGADGDWHIPGDASGPVLYGDLVLTYEGGAARGRSVRDGAVRWEQPLPKGTRVGDVVLGERTVFFTVKEDDSTSVHAFDAASGRPLWQRPLSNRKATGTGGAGGAGGAGEVGQAGESVGGDRADGVRFGAQAFAQGRVIATSPGGLTGFDARSGDPVRFTTDSGAACVRVRAIGAEVHCGLPEGGLVTLDAKTLEAVDGASLGKTAGDGLAAQELVDAGSALYRLGPDKDGTRIELQPLAGGEADAEPRTVGTYRAYSPPSEQSIIGKYAVYADNSALYTLPVDGGPRKKHRVEGAPGERNRAADPADPTDPDRHSWQPQILSIGGALWLAYHDGTVTSFELPS
ncbi:protein kinase [Streptomyces sp. NPDC052114]|uniref:protein kinase domain-containing protein n=1 Tax=unclassified Streptomyces TaxID=2593676 RepID=UPI0034135963